MCSVLAFEHHRPDSWLCGRMASDGVCDVLARSEGWGRHGRFAGGTGRELLAAVATSLEAEESCGKLPCVHSLRGVLL